MFKLLSLFIVNAIAQTTSPYVHYPNGHGDSSVGVGFLEEMWKQYPLVVSFVLISMFILGAFFLVKIPKLLERKKIDRDF